MRRINTLLSSILLLSLIFFGYQCSSAEMSSAKLYIQQKNWEKATESLNKEVAKNPKSDEAYFLLGTICKEKDDISGMIANFNKSLGVSTKFKNEIDIYVQSAWAESFNSGVINYNNAAKSKSKDSSAVFLDKSLDKFKSAIELEPDSLESYKIVSMIYLNKGEFDNAIPILQKIIDKKGSDYAYAQLSDIYVKKGEAKNIKYKSGKNVADSTAAIENFMTALNISKQGLNVHPGNEILLQSLATIYGYLNKGEEGATLFQSEVQKNPSNKLSRLYYGIFLTNIQNYTEAVAQFAEVIKLDHEFVEAYYFEAFAYYNWGLTILKKADQMKEDGRPEANPRFELCVENANTYISKAPKEKKGYELLFKAYSRLSKTKEAEEIQKKIQELK
jgi:tetratricopeptide (TPR) repeat protein